MKPIDELHALGQSLWYDNIQRSLLQNGELAGMIARGEIRGVTSNPSIFQNAIAKTNDYDDALKALARRGLNAGEIFYQLAIEDIQAAADLFRPLYEATDGGDGYVSLEVDPRLAHDTDRTVEEAFLLWKRVDRPNLMIKIPATLEGLPAVRRAVAAGLNVNVTLIFSLARYAEVIDAYLGGLEDRLERGLPLNSIASVASFFVSRVDSKVDALLEQHAGAAHLAGKAAIANARLAYALFNQIFKSDRFSKLAKAGARVQRPLWASTSTKNPAYRDVMYVEELIGAQTVNTVPPQTLKAFGDHGVARVTLTADGSDAQKILDELAAVGISMQSVTDELEREGVKAFEDAFTNLLAAIDARAKEA